MMHFWPPNGFQLSLIASGAAAVAAVWLYNKWQEQRQRRLAKRMFQTDHADVLLGDNATDNADAFDDTSDDTSDDAPDDTPEPIHVSRDGRIEPVFTVPVEDEVEDEGEAAAEAVAEIGGAAAASPAEPSLDLADPQVDCLVHFSARKPIPASRLRATAGAVVGLRWRWIGLDSSGQWRQLSTHDTAPYRHLIAALQLADRSGPLGEVDLTRHLAAVRQLAESINATIELPEPAAVLVQADQLDRFCAGVDWRLRLNVVSAHGAAFDRVELLALIEAAGLNAREDGNYQAVDAAGQPQFTLAAPAAEKSLAGVTLSLDVPLVADGLSAFDRLLALARELTAQADGLLVDDQRVPLTDASLVAIRAKIGEFQQKMAARDIPAGGRRARRLYS